ADVRDLERAAGRCVDPSRELHHVAGEDAEAAAAGRFVAGAEEDLKAEADAEVRRARGDALAQDVADAGVERARAVAEGPLAGGDELVRAPQEIRIVRDAHRHAAGDPRVLRGANEGALDAA